MKKLGLWLVMLYAGLGAVYAQPAPYTMAGKNAVAYNGAKIKSFDWVYVVTDNTIAIRSDDKWALADYTGKRKTKFLFADIKRMPTGVTFVYGPQNQMGLVDVEGNLTVGLQCYDIKIVANNFIRLYGGSPEGPKAGLADAKGKVIVPIGADGIDILTARGLIAVKKGGKISFLDLDGKELCPPTYTDYLADNPKLSFILVKKDTKWGFMDNSGREQLAPTYDIIISSTAPGGYLLMRQGEDWGLIDTTGTLVLAAQYWNVAYLKPNYAAVLNDSLWGVVKLDSRELVVPQQYQAIAGAVGNKILAMQNGRWGIINFENTTVVPFKYDNTDNSAFETGLLPVRYQRQILLVDTLGRELLGNPVTKTAKLANGNVWARQDGAWQLQTPTGANLKTDEVERLRWYSDNMTVGINGGKFGLLDNNGKAVTAFDYDSVSFFTPTIAIVYKERKKGLVDATGKTVLPVNYYFIQSIGKGFYAICEGNFEVQYRNKIPVRVVVCKFGLVDETGKIVLPPQYDEIDEFVGAFAPVKLNGKRGLIDSLGRGVITPKYDRITAFQGNVAWVRVGDRWGLIDSQGNELLEPQFSDDYRLLLPNTPPEQLQAYYPRFVNGYAKVCAGRRWGIVSQTGKIIADPIYEQLNILDSPTKQTLALAREKKKWGTLGFDGKYVIKPKFFDITEFTEGLARASTTSTYGYINERGEDVIPYNFTKAGAFKNGKAVVSVNGRYFIIDTDGRPIIE